MNAVTDGLQATYQQVAPMLPYVGAGSVGLLGYAAPRAFLRARTTRPRAALDALVVPIVALAVAALGAGALYTSLAKVSALADQRGVSPAWLPGMIIDGAIVVATIIDLALAPRGKRAVWMERLQWLLILVTVGLNIYGEDLFGALLHGPQPLIAKAAVAGLKVLIIARASAAIVERIPALRWLQAPVGTFWIWRLMVLGRVDTYTEALELDGQVAARAIEHEARRRAVSARDQVLYRKLTGEDVPAPVLVEAPPAEVGERPLPELPPGDTTTAPARRQRGGRKLTDDEIAEKVDRWLTAQGLEPTQVNVKAAGAKLKLPCKGTPQAVKIAQLVRARRGVD